MRRNFGIIAGATAVAATIVVATQTGMSERPRRVAGAPTVDVTGEQTAPVGDLATIAAPAVEPPSAAEVPAPLVLPGAAAELETEIVRLTARLDERETEFAALQATLAERDASLAARDAELVSLRAELHTLRQRFAFELRLAALKEEDAPAEAALVPARAAAPAAAEPMTAIHFESGSARLTPGGQAHAAAAAVMLADMPRARIRVNGYADRTGDPARNQALAEARARSVADFLIANGVPAEAIETAGMIAADALPIATGPGVSEPLNRAATITPVPPPMT